MKSHYESQIQEYLTYLSDCKYIGHCKYFLDIASNYFENVPCDEKQIGITSITFPELFVRASGAVPVYLFGGYEGNIGDVDEIFPQISDNSIKAIMNLLLDEEMPFENRLNGVIVPITNDSNRKIAGYLKEKGYDVLSVEHTPFVLNTTASQYVSAQKMFLKNIQKMTKRLITKKKLIESARKITAAHQLFARIDASQLETKLKIFLKETYYLVADTDRWQEEVTTLLNGMPKLETQEEQLLLVGGNIQFPNHKIGLILEETGVMDYASHCCVPYPYDYSELNEKQSLPMLYKQIFDIHYRNQYNSEFLGSHEVSFGQNTKAVVFHLLKGQLLSAYYADKVEKNCIAQNIPFICIETDYTKADKEQIKIRIEAFTELLKVRKRSGDSERKMA